MEKKYKLIKEYPGSPKLGTIASYREIYSSMFSTPIKDYKTEDSVVSLRPEVVERQPEFWEFVGGKDTALFSYNEIIHLITDEPCGNNFHKLRTLFEKKMSEL